LDKWAMNESGNANQPGQFNNNSRKLASSFKSMQYANKSPVYTRHSCRVNTFALLESALRSHWLLSEAASVEHSLSEFAPNWRRKVKSRGHTRIVCSRDFRDTGCAESPST
jgi:hypothetical protein